MSCHVPFFHSSKYTEYFVKKPLSAVVRKKLYSVFFLSPLLAHALSPSLVHVQVKVINRSKRAIEFELVDAQDLGTGRLEAKGVRFVPALPTTLGPRESTMVEVCACVRVGGGIGGFVRIILLLLLPRCSLCFFRRCMSLI